MHEVGRIPWCAPPDLPGRFARTWEGILMRRWLSEFREFAVRGSVVDLAVGLIIGGAFSKIVESLVRDILMPPIGVLLRRVDFSDLRVTLIEAPAASETTTGTLASSTAAAARTLTHSASASPFPLPGSEEVAIWYGRFINNVIHFVIVAFAVYLLVRQINRLKRQPEKLTANTRECPRCISVVPIRASRCPHCTSELEALPV